MFKLLTIFEIKRVALFEKNNSIYLNKIIVIILHFNNFFIYIIH